MKRIYFLLVLFFILAYIGIANHLFAGGPTVSGFDNGGGGLGDVTAAGNNTFTGTNEFQAGAIIDGYLQLFDTPLTTAPATPIDGAVYCADYINWDPITYSGAVAYLVLYDGASYIGLLDIDGNFITNGDPAQIPIEGDPDTITLTSAQYRGGTVIFNDAGDYQMDDGEDGDILTFINDDDQDVTITPDSSDTIIAMLGNNPIERDWAQGEAADFNSVAGMCVALFAGSNTWLFKCTDTVTEETP